MDSCKRRFVVNRKKVSAYDIPLLHSGLQQMSILVLIPTFTLRLCKRRIVVPRQWRCGLRLKDCEWVKDWRGEGSQGWGSTTRIGEVWGVHCKMYLSKIQKVFVPIARCVCPNDKMYLSLLLNVKLQKWRIVGASAVRVKLNNKERRSGLCVKKRNPRRYSRW